MSSSKKTRLAELRVGVLVLATIVILIVFILSVTGDISLFAKRLEIKTRFATAEGLKSGDEVRLAGKRVGKVEEVELGPIPSSPDEKTIVVTMSLDSGEATNRIRTDSIATLGQQGFLGDRVIDISPGTQAGDAVRNGQEIQSSPQAGLAQVFQGANDILVQFNAVGKQLQDMMEDINRGEGNIGKFLHDDAFYVNLNRTVLESQELVKRVREGEGTIPKLINDGQLYADLRKTTNELQAIAADLRAGKGTAGKFINDEKLYREAAEAAAKANTAVERVERLMSDLEAGKGTVGKLFKDEKLHADLQSAIASVRSLTDRLDRGEGTAGKLMRDEALYNNMNQLSSEMVKMLYDFRQNPRKYLSIKVSLF
jgi:phospholipid/cholesterol/gamma-HCH transport system substrate-binding protein